MSRGAGESGEFVVGLMKLSSEVRSIIFCPFLNTILSVEAFLMLELIPDAVLSNEGMEPESKQAAEPL